MIKTNPTKITKVLFWTWMVVSTIFTVAGNVDAQEACVPPPSGMVGWWPGEDITNDIVSGNNGTTEGDVAFLRGRVGQGFSLDGTYDSIATSLVLPTVGTIECWINPSSLSDIHGIIGTVGDDNGNDRLWLTARGPLGGLGVDPNRLVVNLGSCCANEIVVESPLVVGTWTHIALTFDYDSDQYQLYVDGVIKGESTAPRDPPTHNFSIGGFTSSFGQSFFFPGLMDEITLYNRVLNASEIKDIYDTGAAGKCKPLALPCPGLQSPTNMTATGSILYGHFGLDGICMYNGSGWSQVTPSNPETIAATGSLLYGNFGSDGIWKYEAGAWTNITKSIPKSIAASGSLLYGNFGPGGVGYGGIWMWNGIAWSQVTKSSPETMVASGSLLYGNFGSDGIWQWNGAVWSKITE